MCFQMGSRYTTFKYIQTFQTTQEHPVLKQCFHSKRPASSETEKGAIPKYPSPVNNVHLVGRKGPTRQLSSHQLHLNGWGEQISLVGNCTSQPRGTEALKDRIRDTQTWRIPTYLTTAAVKACTLDFLSRVTSCLTFKQPEKQKEGGYKAMQESQLSRGESASSIPPWFLLQVLPEVLPGLPSMVDL